MSDAAVTPTAVKATQNAVTSLNETFGATIVQGKVVYRDGNSKLQLSDANGADAAKSVFGITLNSGADGQPGAVVTKDPAFNPGFACTPAMFYVLSGTAGGIAPITDLASGMKAILLGVGNDDGTLNLNILTGGSLA